jgi:hypothetical protein
MKKSPRLSVRWTTIALPIVTLIFAPAVLSQTSREMRPSLKTSIEPHKDHKSAKPISEFKYSPAKNFLPIRFETLGNFEIKVEWVMNPTNSAADSLKKEGEIPARVKALDGKKISIAGFMKPIKQDVGGSTEFLIVPNYFTCCEGEKPRVNQWLHVVSPQAPIPLANDRPLAVRGVLRVGEKLSGSNVVSIYQLENVELELIDSEN